MTIPRSKQVDVSVSRWYHCISRCVRGAALLGEGGQAGNRKAWLEARLKCLDAVFAVSVGGFSVLDNHLHVLVRLDPHVAQGWSDAEVVRRWLELHPPRSPGRKPLSQAKLEEQTQKYLADADWLAERRQRLASLSWFMKCLKEPLSRMVNKAENRRGTFFEARFKSIMVLDDEALLSVCAYIDLNPLAAGLASTPEESPHTSVKARVDHVRQQGRMHDLLAARQGGLAGSQAAAGLEEELWLIPLEDRRRLDSQREGMLEAFTLAGYLSLVDYTGRLRRHGKATIDASTTDVLERLGTSPEMWQARIESLQGERWLGRFFASSRQKLQQVAQHFGLRRPVNLSSVAKS